MVGDVAHRIQRLARGARVIMMLRCCRSLTGELHINNRQRIKHAARANIAAGLAAAVRTPDKQAA
jgi:hypothetical protein